MRLPLRRAAAVLTLAALALAGAAPRDATAQDWPSRPITMVVSFQAAGMMDYIGRAIAQDLTATLGQTVVVENKPGGGGVVGAVTVAKAEPDGYTLLVSAIGPMLFRPIIEKNLGYDTEKDFAPIILVGDAPHMMLVNPKLGVKSVKDLIDHASRNEKRLTIGHPGPGTTGHLCGILFAREARLDGNLIAYRGAPAIINDLLAGTIDIGLPAFGPGVGAVPSLATTSDARVDFLPGVPTLRDSGYDVVCSTWIAIYGPAKLPQPIVAKLNAAIDAFLRKPEARDMFNKIGLRVLGGRPEQLPARVAADRAIWTRIIAGMTFETPR